MSPDPSPQPQGSTTCPARPGFPLMGAETAARRGAASEEPPRPRPAAPHSHRPAARAAPGPAPGSRCSSRRPPGAKVSLPRPAATGSEVTGSTNETLRAGGPARGDRRVS